MRNDERNRGKKYIYVENFVLFRKRIEIEINARHQQKKV